MTTHITPTTTLTTSIHEPILFLSLRRPTHERLPLQRLRDPHLLTWKSSTIPLPVPPNLSIDPTRRPRSTTTTRVSSTGRVTLGSRNTCRGEKTSATTATRRTLPSLNQRTDGSNERRLQSWTTAQRTSPRRSKRSPLRPSLRNVRSRPLAQARRRSVGPPCPTTKA